MKFDRREFVIGGLAGLWASQYAGASTTPVSVEYDAASLKIGGRRELLICGEMHYSRSTRAMWPGLLERSRGLGLNAIASYVFWGVHEPQRGVFDFTEENDLPHFLELCQMHGLKVFLRVGPYCCAEWNFGGFPAWLRDEPGIVFRTMNDPYLRRVELYFEQLARVVKPYLASNGGPVILVQVENEYANIAKRYGAAGQEYLRWIVELGRRVGFSAVPNTTCEGGAAGAIETANGNTIGQGRVDEIRKSHPGTPVLWSELYPAWYQLWGGPHPKPRTPQDMATSILAFLGEGGSGWNYYMWHGGTNFGRTSMYLQRTSYDFSAPLDEFGRESMLGLYLGGLHRCLRAYQHILLEGERTRTVQPNGVVAVTWTLGPQNLQLLANETGVPIVNGAETLASHSARLSAGAEILFDTEAQLQRTEMPTSDWSAVVRPAGWMTWSEPLPAQRTDAGTASLQPVEQLLLTRDSTDYCWYSTTITSAAQGGDSAGGLVIPYGGDFFYVYVDGKLAGHSQKPFFENRGPIVPESAQNVLVNVNRHDQEHADGYRQQFALGALSPGPHRLDLLCAAMGLIKGDWQIGYSMSLERKGIWEGVEFNGKAVEGWQMRPYLAGEQMKLHLGTTRDDLWKAATSGPPAGLTWHRASFALAPAVLAGDGDFRLDAKGLVRGSIYVNGHHIGRFWDIEAADSGEPSQRYYHVPRAWLSPTNKIVIFDEQLSSAADATIERRNAGSRTSRKGAA